MRRRLRRLSVARFSSVAGGSRSPCDLGSLVANPPWRHAGRTKLAKALPHVNQRTARFPLPLLTSVSAAVSCGAGLRTKRKSSYFSVEFHFV